MSEMSKSVGEEDVNVLKNISKVSLVGKEFPENLQRHFFSEPTISTDKPDVARKISSDPNIGHEINYDDLCGPWSCPEISVYQRYDVPLIPKICTWVFIEETDIRYMKRFQDDKEAILTLIGNKLPNNILFRGRNKEIFLQLMWEVFRFARDNGYTEISISSLLGLYYFTHRYFLTTLWRTATETYEFFKEGVLLHSVLHPPKSFEVFTPKESKQTLDLFWTLYMRQLPLLRFACLPNYRLIITLERDSSELRKEEKEVEKVQR